ncbi:hypothetical protein [Planococcus sp. CAU13]|uniref:hypothetical protein n=1 Tax=Planococcus sp. CAU13 TaxID=1541197 RepID=UPI00052FFB4D|nr:hypothetical protein [Planococcus sp. CAU13]
MKQTIGNVGVLNLLNATEQSVQAYERIGNVGFVLFRSGQSHLLAALNIGNIGKTVEVPEDYSYYNGTLEIDRNYLESIDQPMKMVVNGMLIFGHDVEAEHLNNKSLDFIVNGEIFAPAKLAGQVSRQFSRGESKIEVYEGAPPRIENGSITLSNAFLEAAEEPVHLIVNGKLAIPKDIDTELFKARIKKIAVNGLLSVHQEQEALIYGKMDSAPNGVIEVIPAGYRILKKSLRVNSRSIKSFREEKLMTRKPLVFEADVTREAVDQAISRIDSRSFIVCHESIEDVIYEKLERLETEVLSYASHFILIDGEEQWSDSQFRALEEPISLIVNGTLVLDGDVTGETIMDKLKTLDVFGEVEVDSADIKGALQGKIRVNTGRLGLKDDNRQNDKTLGSSNIGELIL